MSTQKFAKFYEKLNPIYDQIKMSIPVINNLYCVNNDFSKF